jgi:hypothetical protein
MHKLHYHVLRVVEKGFSLGLVEDLQFETVVTKEPRMQLVADRY